jgi:hypothetical protein
MASPWIAQAGPTNWVREVEIVPEPVQVGHQVFSVRFTPDKTVTYDMIAFECVYRQEFPWEDVRGRKYTKIHEPVTFAFRRPGVSFVAELDAYVNFRVPLAMPLLVQSYGPTAFNKEYPVTVHRIRITATAGGRKAWFMELAAKGRFDARPLTPYKEPPPPDGSTNAAPVAR